MHQTRRGSDSIWPRNARLALSSIEERYLVIKKRIADHARDLEKYKAVAFELAPKQVAYNPLVRTFKDAQDTYRIVLARYRATELTGRVKLINIDSLDEALVPSSPAYPSLRRNVAMAVGLSLILGVALAFGLEFLDRTVKTIEPAQGV